MKKLKVFGLSLVILIFLFTISLVSAIIISEVELNPEGSDSGNEWLELYSEQAITLSGWKLVNNDNEVINLSQSFQGYLIINFSGQWLDNSDEKIILKDNDVVHETIILDDSFNDNRTWQYCNGNWKMADGTKNSANSCSLQNQTQNNNTQQNNTNPQTETKISLELEWDKNEIVNGEDFEIEIKAYNLKDENYDIKVYIVFKNNDTIISETYNEKENKWESSSYYINDILSGVGNKSKSFELRIKEKYRNFSGNADIGTKIKKSASSSIIAEIKKDVEILESVEEEAEKKEETKEITTEQGNSEATETTGETEITSVKQTGNVIRLGNRSKAQQKVEEKKKEETSGKIERKENILYESGSEKVKKYAIYGLNLILIILLIFLLTSFKKEKKLKNVKKTKKNLKK